MFANSTDAETVVGNPIWDNMYGWKHVTSTGTLNTDVVTYMWKRAPGFCDVVAYTGTGSSNAVAHNLTVAPEMVWIKHRSSAPYGNENWTVGVPTTNNPAKGLYLNTDASFRSGNDDIGAVSASTFTVGSHPRSNSSGVNYIAYLFASLPGISKVGSYTGDGTTNGSKVIDCGFSNGASFVLIKRTSGGNSEWYVFDTTRGIVSGNEGRIELNTTSAELASDDFIDPVSSGFAVNGHINQSNETYIFYAIA